MSLKRLRSAIAGLDLEDETPFLLLGWNETAKAVAGGTYPIHEDMTPELQSIAAGALEDAENLSEIEYDGATLIARGEDVLWVPRERMREDSPLVGLLLTPDALPTVSRARLADESLAFSAIGFGARPADRTFFVKRRARHLHANTTIFLTLRGSLRPISDPIITIERSVDFIIRPEGAVVFNAEAFERYVQEPADIAAEFGMHADNLATQLPFDGETLMAFKKVGSSKLMSRGRMRSIIDSDHFEKLTIPAVRNELKRLQLDSHDFIKSNKMSFGPQLVPFVLKILDNAAWRGGFNNELYSTEGKRREAP